MATREIFPKDVHIDAVLSNFAYEYAQSQEGFIGERVFPPLDVAKQSDLFYVGDKSAFTLEGEFKRAPGAEYDMVTWTHSDDNYYCDSFGLSTAIESEVLANQDAILNLGQKAARVLVGKFQLAYEKRVADLFVAGTFTNGETLSGNDQWNVRTGSETDPVLKIVPAIESVASKIFRPANTLVMSFEVFSKLRSHPKILANLFGTVGPKPAFASAEQIAQLCGVDNVIIGNAKYYTGSALANVWGKNCAVCYLDPNAGRGTDQVVVPGRTFVWNVDGVGRYQVSAPEYRRNRKAYVWYIDDYTDEKVISVDAVYLLTNAIA